MASTLPEVRFKYGWLVADAASVTLNEKWGDGTPLKSAEEYEAVAKQYQEWWLPLGATILRVMTDTLQLEFRQNTLDVYVVPWFYAISDPLIVGPTFKSQDEVINLLTHELVHRLVTDNTKAEYGENMIEDWRTLFGNLPFNTITHIPVYAVMKSIFLEALNRPDLLHLEVQNAAKDAELARAWAYIERQGYQTIVDKLVMQFEMPSSGASNL